MLNAHDAHLLSQEARIVAGAVRGLLKHFFSYLRFCASYTRTIHLMPRAKVSRIRANQSAVEAD
jgi:hypothetical protein